MFDGFHVRSRTWLAAQAVSSRIVVTVTMDPVRPVGFASQARRLLPPTCFWFQARAIRDTDSAGHVISPGMNADGMSARYGSTRTVYPCMPLDSACADGV